ncbi:MAG: hypothetical protein HY701_13490 [Gemmatimonadetes bacterium]|nr:hypothetical protein [Gemmatimonadota bacterium]
MSMRVAARTVVVDRDKCLEVAAALKGKPVPMDREDVSLDDLSTAAGNFLFLTVAISHQTSPMGRRPLAGDVGGTRRHGWDFLVARLKEAAKRDPSLLEPARWRTLTAEALENLLRDRRLGGRLTNAVERATLIRDLGDVMVRHGWSDVHSLYEASGRSVRTILSALEEFQAYSDPVRKKSHFFLALMRNNGIWKYVDEEYLGPPVDYHEVRGHLRIGTVRVEAPDLLAKLRHRQPVDDEEDTAIRSAVFEAIVLIADVSGLKDASRLHYLFWHIFRSVCTREQPHCLELRRDCTLPLRYRALAEFSTAPSRCPFSDVCMSARRSDRLNEHAFETHYY